MLRSASLRCGFASTGSQAKFFLVRVRKESDPTREAPVGSMHRLRSPPPRLGVHWTRFQATMSFSPGSTLGPYTITAELGRGGMGVVYTAQDPRLKRQVAIKLLTADLTRDETAKQRFLQEAQAASALDHPNICTIHEINETDDGQLYLVMSYYEGETLKERIVAPNPVISSLQSGEPHPLRPRRWCRESQSHCWTRVIPTLRSSNYGLVVRIPTSEQDLSGT